MDRLDELAAVCNNFLIAVDKFRYKAYDSPVERECIGAAMVNGFLMDMENIFGRNVGEDNARSNKMQRAGRGLPIG